MILLALIPLLIVAPACTDQSIRRSDPAAEEHHEDVHQEDHADGVIEIDPVSGEFADIQVTKSRRISFQDYLETTGVISVNEGRVAHIRPLTKGIVEEVFVLPGDDVVSGQPLIRYDNIEMSELLTDYQSRKAELRRAEAELEVTQKLWERGKQLYAAQAIAENDLDLRQAKYRRAGETVNVLQLEIEKAASKLRRYGLTGEAINSGNVGGQEESPSGAYLRSPFAGTVLEFDVAEGEVISPDRVLMSISDLSTVWVLADIYEKDIGRIKGPGALEVLIEAFPDQIFRGQITYLGDRVNPQTRTVRVRAELSNPRRRLKLGMYGRVRIPLGTERDFPAVPNAALQKIGDEEIVFVQLAPHHFEPRVIRTGPTGEGWTAIEEGLAGGEEVVGRGSFSLKSEFLRERLGGGHAH